MPDERREIRIKRPASHTLLSTYSFIPRSCHTRKRGFTELGRGVSSEGIHRREFQNGRACRRGMALFRKILGSVLLKDDTWIDLDGVLGIENGLKRGRFCLALAVA